MRLPESWVETSVGNVVVDIQPGFAQKPGEEDEGTTPQIRTHNVSPEGKITLEGIKHVSASAKELEKYRLAVGDVVFNNTNSEEWVGKTAVFDQQGEYVFSNHMTRLRVNDALILPDYLASYLHFLWAQGYSKTKAKRWVSQAGVESAVLALFKLPLPTLPEQQRIVDVLREMERIAKLQRHLVELWKEFQTVLFFSSFGNPATNRNGYRKISLGDVVDCFSGGTPSRDRPDYWSGKIPWVSPKDMKFQIIRDAEEHISESALKESSTRLIPQGSVLVVTRSGILQSQLPIGITESLVTINQDIKALVPHDTANGIFLACQLVTLTPIILTQVRQGATVHNIETDRLLKTKIVLPSIEQQELFANTFKQGMTVLGNVIKKASSIDYLREHLLLSAFSGELTSEWRNKESAEIKTAATVRDSILREKGAKLLVRTIEPLTTELATDSSRPARRWLIDELSEFQREIWDMLRHDWRGSVIMDDPEMFDDFCTGPQTAGRIERFKASPNRVRRTLEQLAALGLIAKVSAPKLNAASQQTEYLTAFRPLREDENTRLRDAAWLRRELGGEVVQDSFPLPPGEV